MEESEQVEELQESPAPAKKRKLTKAAEAKLKAAEKKKKKGKGKKGSDDEDYEEEDPYTSLSKSLWSTGSSKPPVGSFENCAKCEKQFTVVSRSFSESVSLSHVSERRSIRWLQTPLQDGSVIFAPRPLVKTRSRNRHRESAKRLLTSER